MSLRGAKPRGNLGLNDLGEFGLINLLTKGFKPNKEVLVGVGDDCAVLKYRRNEYLLWTTDLLFSGVHFTEDASPYSIGWKALAISISDIAAMAGIPKYGLVFVGLPPHTTVSYSKEIYRGISELAGKYRVKIVGGDTNAFEKLVIGTTVLGVVEKKYLTLRSGAQTGDLICVSGPLGKGKKTHLSFLPKVQQARRIKRLFSATAMIDISDGLLSDFTRIAEKSRVGGKIFLSQIPCVSGIRPEKALTSGEEFELLFTVKPEYGKAVYEAGFFVVGKVTSRSFGVKAFNNTSGNLYKPSRSGYNHFPEK
ncbi:MAG: thiamine-phosphate kinase [Candidatus Omnitrophota bacterium]|nr:thiamine-phosphate kinase [Candidatus Omnitrophota bacterium]